MSPSPLYLKIQNDLTAAMKNKDAFRVNLLRFLKSQIDSAAKDKLADLSDEEVVKVIAKRLKQSKDAQEKFIAGARPELAEAEKQEAEAISIYLPQQLSEEELRSIVKKVIAESGATSAKDFGRVMGAVVKQVKGQADGQKIKSLVEESLS